MEQRRMNSQQLTHNAHDAVSFDILQSPFCPSFPELLEESKAMQAPRPSSSYVQHYTDSGAPITDEGSPPLPYHIHEHPQQGHPRLDTSPAQQQHQPRHTVAHPLFPHDHEGLNTTPQGLSHQLSRAAPHSPRIPIDPWAIGTFSDNPITQPTALREGYPPVYGVTYPLRPQPLYPPATPHRSAPTHAPPEQSQSTTTPGPSTFHEQHEDKAIVDPGQRPRLWGGAGSLDPATGVFHRASDHPRIRTPQACEKCRARKAKCSGEHPTCQRCHERGLECKYAAERRMRGPNKPKLPLTTLPDGSPQPAVAEGQKTRKRASTLPTVQRRGLQIWDAQQRHLQEKPKQRQQQHEQGIVAAAAASPASSASSAGSGSLGYPPLSESEASPMTQHSSLDNRHSAVSFPASPQVLVQDFSANTQPGVLSHVNESNNYEDGHEGAVATEGMVAGTYEQEVLSRLRLSFENTKTF